MFSRLIRLWQSAKLVPTFIRRAVDFLGLPEECVYISHVLLYALLLWVVAETTEFVGNLRITVTPDGAIDWARTAILHSSDCFLNLDKVLSVERTTEFVRVNGLKRAMPHQWCLPAVSALHPQEQLKLERLTGMSRLRMLTSRLHAGRGGQAQPARAGGHRGQCQRPRRDV
jgi:hypothetical protein